MPVRHPRARRRDAIQNVGAYGQEVADTITRVRVYDRATGRVMDLAAAGCGFGYRTSAFKRSITPPAVTGRFVVLGVTFELTSDRSPGRSATPNWPGPWAWTQHARPRPGAGPAGQGAGQGGPEGGPGGRWRARAGGPRWATCARPCSGCGAARAWW